MRLTLLLAVGTVLAGCGTDSGSSYVASFRPPAVAPGYTRFLTPVVKGIAPGDDVEYCQWVAGPASTALDVMDVSGMQSLTGHHAALFATTETQFAVGETHICTEQEMLSVAFIAGIGGEGTASSANMLPEGLSFRVPVGQALMINSHWLNATDEMVDGQAVIDVKFAPASDQRQTADLFANDGRKFQIPPGRTTYDASCVLQQDLNLVMAANHMHDRGATVFSELVHPDGTKATLLTEPAWSAEEQFNPKYSKFSLAAPMIAHAGDTYHTHCEWQNTTTRTFTFPDEMCVGLAFYFPAQGHIVCIDGVWPAPST
jgi:hypothetical protein